jgi:GTP-binding protein
VFADIPGLIAGAAQGAGLGHEFLRHIERTRLLIHLVDASSDDVVRDLQVVQQELASYDTGLSERPTLVALTKIELLLDEELQERRQLLEEHCGGPVLAISAAAAQNLDQLLAATWRELGI